LGNTDFVTDITKCPSARIYRDVPVPMRDGTVLRADVWVPERPGRVPVLLERLPYDKSISVLTTLEAGLEPARAVAAGYAVVLQDTRGRFASEGCFEPLASEASDGLDTVDWCASLPFCDGTVGMFGASYFGTTQLLAAASASPALRAIAPTVTGADVYEGWTYQGGAFQLGFALFWTLLILAPDIVARLPVSRRGRYEELVAEAARDLDALYWRLPLDDLGGLEEILPFYVDWLAHDTRDEFWRAHTVTSRYSSIRTPALHVGGWYDLFAAGTIANYGELRRGAATEEARRGQRLVMGPWSHGNFADAVGELRFGAAAAKASLDTTGMMLDFFDAHLRGRPLEQPDVQVFLMGADIWTEESDWPPPTARRESWFLHSDGSANTRRGDGTLSRRSCAADEASDSFVYDPTDPVPTVGGATFLPGASVSHNAGPKCQRPVEEREDVLVYVSDPLTESFDVVGPVSAILSVATSAPDTDFTAKLVDVHPDGCGYVVCDGIVSLRHARRATPGTSPPGRGCERVRVELGPTAMRFRAGHRIRLDVSSSNFPRFARNPNSGVPPTQARASDLRPALQQVFHDADRPSAVELTVRR
jgi:putative CocE/NonD family hydrolase